MMTTDPELDPPHSFFILTREIRNCSKAYRTGTTYVKSIMFRQIEVADQTPRRPNKLI